MIISSIYAAVLTLFYVFLSLRIVQLRFKHRISLGDNNNDQIIRSIRAHGNFIEYVPLGLLLLFMCEINGVPSLTLHILGSTLVFARLAHVFGITSNAKISKMRAIGMLITTGVLVAESVIILMHLLPA